MKPLKFALCICISLSLGALSSPAHAQVQDQRIVFKKGAVQALVTGTLKSKEEKCYLANARSGQHMKVEILGDGPTRGTVKFPSGEGEGQPGGLIFDDELKESGDFRICVEESQMANPWSGKFALKVYIK